jgi:ribosomal protein L44E
MTDQGVRVQIDSVQQIIDAAYQIRKEASNPKYKDTDENDVIKKIQDIFKDFSRSFPIMLRHIVQTRKVYPEVIKRYVKLCQAQPTHSISEFQQRQADYLAMVYRKEHPRAGQKEIALIRAKYEQNLKKEEEYMKKVMDVISEERKTKRNEFNELKRNELFDLINKNIDQIPDDITIDIEKEVEAPIEVVTRDESIVLVGGKTDNKPHFREDDEDDPLTIAEEEAERVAQSSTTSQSNEPTNVDEEQNQSKDE